MGQISLSPSLTLLSLALLFYSSFLFFLTSALLFPSSLLLFVFLLVLFLFFPSIFLQDVIEAKRQAILSTVLLPKGVEEEASLIQLENEYLGFIEVSPLRHQQALQNNEPYILLSTGFVSSSISPSASAFTTPATTFVEENSSNNMQPGPKWKKILPPKAEVHISKLKKLVNTNLLFLFLFLFFCLLFSSLLFSIFYVNVRVFSDVLPLFFFRLNPKTFKRRSDYNSSLILPRMKSGSLSIWSRMSAQVDQNPPRHGWTRSSPLSIDNLVSTRKIMR